MGDNMTLSLCMIVKNEEINLDRLLNQVNTLFDEIIIVDTGSTDNTKNVALKYTNLVFDFTWINDFSKARNYSLSKASMDYIMWLDADDFILDENIIKIKELKNNLDFDIALFKYNTGYDKEFSNYTLSYYRERIFINNNRYFFIDPIHEYIPLIGNIKYLDISIEHYKLESTDPLRNLKIYEELESKNHIFTPRQLYYYARELFDNKKYKKSIEFLKKFIKTKKGWIEDEINSCILLYKAYANLNKTDFGVKYLYESFNYDIRAEAIYEIGNFFYNKKEYEKAIYFYRQIFNFKLDKYKGFVFKDVYNFYPLIMISLCNFELNKIKKAIYYNDLAKLYKPNSEIVINNDKFFKSLI